jgi:hypothetical protein
LKTGTIRTSALALLLLTTSPGFTAGFESIRFWTGTGTNRAGLVIYWNSPEVLNNSTVPPPIADQSLAWGFRWNGEATGEEMLRAISAADPRLFTMINVSAFGASILGFGYDLNNNRVFGLRAGTSVLAPRAFTNGVATLPISGVDTWQSLDPADLFWSGWTGPGWETWQEQGGAGGFIEAPERGSSDFWTPDDPTQPYSGRHGQWQLAGAGLSGLALKDGSWVGFAVARGGLDFANPEADGTIAYNLHKQAPKTPTGAPEPASPFAAAVVEAQGAFGNSPYDDPASVLGMPSTDYYDPFGEVGGGTKERRVKLVEGAFNYDWTQTNKLITTFETNSSVIVLFDQAVTNHPANPYGIDFIVFGNSFYGADRFVNEASDMNSVKSTGGLFGEPVKISVSPGFTGRAGEVEDEPGTWPWYRYENGPYGDTGFPTQGYVWNRNTTNWSDQPMDFTKPVNPAFAPVLEAGDLSVADAIDLYTGSGGGTGFDLASSGFDSIRYARIEGIAPDWLGGEIDALAVVRPATLNDVLCVTPSDLTNSPLGLMFQEPLDTKINRLRFELKSLDAMARVEVNKLSPSNFTGLAAIDVQVRSAVGGDPVSFVADAQIGLGRLYSGDGNDLNVMIKDGARWVAKAFAFNGASNTVTLAGITNSIGLAVVRVASPALVAVPKAQGLEVQFQTIAGWTHILERTVDFGHWSEVARVTAQTLEEVVVLDETAMPKAFYRLRVLKP